MESANLPLLNKAAVERLLASRLEGGIESLSELPDPYGLRDMQKAAARIADAIRHRERIAVVGDYDVDGIVSTALMEEFFEIVGYGVQTLIPNRFDDGYGITPALLDRIDADVIITVDNGIAALEAAKACRDRGIDLIITDHHTPPDTLPDAYAIVNPKHPECTFGYPEICGAQVAWFLIGALKRELGIDLKMGRFLDLLALAIVADVMPLVSINRPLVQKGLAMLSRSTRPAFAAVREALRKERFLAEDIGYGIGPRLNSAGRLADASVALRFLRARSPQEAERLWSELEAINVERRRIENETAEAAIAMARPDDPVIVVAGEGWHEGVVGIVASRLAGRFGKPAVVLSIEGDRAKGSGRSVGEVDLYALLKKSARWLEGFGGHKMAAGLALKRSDLEPFREAICKEAAGLDPALFKPKSRVLGELPLQEVDAELMAILERFEPYGEANPRPHFLLRGMEVLRADRVGAKGSHLKLLLAQEGRRLDAIHFRTDRSPQTGEKISLSGVLQVNRFNGRETIQMVVDQIY